MSVEPSELTSEVWTSLQGHVINGVFPLGRYLGCSDHSGVFLTKSARHPAEVAIKLLPTNRALAESQLPRWKRAGGLTHPHLLRLFEWGGCQLDGLPYLYVLMEYAEQTLAQLLQQRALTDEEAREMLPAVLDALAFLHGRDLVQGQLKPANVLVVGDQIKLASDTIHRFSDAPLNTASSTAYDPPEARQASSSPAGDIWTLGVTVFEALTRRRPPGLGESRGAVVVPADFSPVFRDVLIRCLAFRPQDRLSVTELSEWVRGRSAEPASGMTAQPAALAPPEPQLPEGPPAHTASLQSSAEAARPAPSAAQTGKPGALLTVILGAVVLIALGWIGLRVLKTRGGPAPASVEAPTRAEPPIAASAAPAGGGRAPARNAVATPPSALHQVIPDVPQSARRTIRGHIKVWVRVVIDEHGSVLAAVADRTGPSGYFQRLAVEAARKWTFPSVDTPSRRTMQIRFDFDRDATTAHAVTLH
jgi:outer membrane biosynthesis protein TonB